LTKSTQAAAEKQVQTREDLKGEHIFQEGAPPPQCKFYYIFDIEQRDGKSTFPVGKLF
jgi:CRP-like cAMP-binding protein